MVNVGKCCTTKEFIQELFHTRESDRRGIVGVTTIYGMYMAGHIWPMGPEFDTCGIQSEVTTQWYFLLTVNDKNNNNKSMP